MEPVLLTLAEFKAIVPPTALGRTPDDELEAAVRTASDEAYSLLGGVFALPLTAWGEDLRRHVANLALYHLLGSRTAVVAEAWRLRYTDALSWFALVRGGKLRPIGLVDSSSPAETAVRRVRIVTNPGRGW